MKVLIYGINFSGPLLVWIHFYNVLYSFEFGTFASSKSNQKIPIEHLCKSQEKN